MVTNMEFFSPLRGSHRKLMLIFLLCLATLNVTACDYVGKLFYPDFKRSNEKETVLKPPFLEDNVPTEALKDIVNNAINDDDITVNPVVIGDKTPDLKTKTHNTKLFNAPVNSDKERFARLEDKVQHLSDMLNKMSPAITRLIDVESELDILTFQLEEIITKGQLNTPPPPTIATRAAVPAVKTMPIAPTSATPAPVMAESIPPVINNAPLPSPLAQPTIAPSTAP